MKPVILIGARGFWSMRELVDAEVFHQAFDLLFDEKICGGDEVRDHIVALVVADQVIDAVHMDRFPNLKTIARTGTGYDNIDIAAAHKRNIIVTRVAKLNANSVSEFALGLVLALLRHIPHIHTDMIAHTWERKYGMLLADVTVGVLGLGTIGQLLVRKLHALGAKRVLGWNRTYRPDIALLEEECRLERCAIRELASQSDVLVVALALSEETRNIVNRDMLSCMKPTALVVNIGRGALVDEEALAEFIADGKLGGAALDVFTTQPPDSTLFEKKFFQSLVQSVHAGKNVILTPHNAGITKHSVRNISLKVALHVDKVLRGEFDDVEIVNPNL